MGQVLRWSLLPHTSNNSHMYTRTLPPWQPAPTYPQLNISQIQLSNSAHHVPGTYIEKLMFLTMMTK